MNAKQIFYCPYCDTECATREEAEDCCADREPSFAWLCKCGADWTTEEQAEACCQSKGGAQ